MLDRLATWWLRHRGYLIASPGLARKYEVTGPGTPTIRVDWSAAPSGFKSSTKTYMFAPPFDDWNSPADQKYDDL